MQAKRWTDAHLLACPAIQDMLSARPELEKVIHENIFQDLDDQIAVTDLYREIFKLQCSPLYYLLPQTIQNFWGDI